MPYGESEGLLYNAATFEPASETLGATFGPAPQPVGGKFHSAPEPCTMILLLAGGLAVAACRWRRRTK